MVIVRLAGGLGNQMFQYAAGLSLAARLKVRVLLDDSGLHGQSHHGFELRRAFTQEFAMASAADVRAILGWRYPLRRLLSRRGMASLPAGPMLVEPSFEFWPKFTDILHPCYLVGYWQSEHYFAEREQLIRDAFRFVPLPEDARKFADIASNTNSVSIHVRRGDYVSNARINAFHGVCSLAYYEQAMKRIEALVPKPAYLVFSDDLAWCRENLKVPDGSHFVDANYGNRSFVDMHLMSLCRHHVVANSSFSWWGAWLGAYSDSMVIAPRKWFASEEHDVSTVCPRGWTRI